METREKSKKNAAEFNENDEESRTTEANANEKDAGRQRECEKPKVNMERILQEIQEFRKENSQQLDDIKDEIKKTNERIKEAEDRIDDVEIRMLTVEQVMRSMHKTQRQHEEKLIDQEGRARRENIRLYNVPENEEGNSMVSFIETLLREKLDFPPTAELLIERAHRALAAKPSATGKPRSIVIKFHRYKTKEEVLRRAWEKKEILLNEQRIFFDHDYPAAVLNKRKEYNEVKPILREKRIRFQTPYPARLRVFYEDGTRLYHTINEATRDMEDRGFPVKVVPPPEDPFEKLNRNPWHAVRGGRAARGGDSPRRADIREKLQVFRHTSA